MRKEQFVPDKVLKNCKNYILSSLKIKEVEAEMKPYYLSILFETIVPILIQSQTYLNLFMNDEKEFIRREDEE
jgi:hypothetical protein